MTNEDSNSDCNKVYKRMSLISTDITSLENSQKAWVCSLRHLLDFREKSGSVGQQEIFGGPSSRCHSNFVEQREEEHALQIKRED